MYDTNFLAKHLRAASVGRENSIFIRLHETDEIISFQNFSKMRNVLWIY